MNPFSRIAGWWQSAFSLAVRVIVRGVVALTFAVGFGAHADSGETVLISRGDVVITRADLDLELQRLPQEVRATLLGSERHVIGLLDRLLVTRELAVKARAQKLDADLKLDGRPTLEQERMLASAWIASVEARASSDFDAKREAWLRRAREIYIADQPRHTVPETVVATQIFFAADRGGAEEARKRALGAATRLEGGADFVALALALSDEPNVAGTRGRIGPVERGKLSPPIAAAVFTLKQPGDVTAPFESPAGWHLFRLEARTPGHVKSFDEVSGAILADLRGREIERARNGVYTELRANNASVTINEPALRALKTAPPAARGPARTPG